MPPHNVEPETVGADAREWVRVGDREYDVTTFRHPGGNVIKYMLANSGADATEAFREFHYRSTRAKAALAALPSRPAEKSTTLKARDHAMLAAFTKFREGLEEEGFFTPSPTNTAGRLLELAVLFAISMAVFAHGGVVGGVVGAAILGLFSGRCGWVQHEGGHNSLTGNMRLDKRIQKFGIGFGLGACGSMWNSMHEKHHATPQKIGHDLDLDTTPLVAFFDTAIESNRRRAYSKAWLAWQAWSFLPITSGMFVMSFWLLFLHPRKVFRSKDWEQGMWMVACHVVRSACIAHAMGASYATGLFFNCMSLWVAGMYLFGHFSLSHTHLAVVGHDDHVNWVEYAVNHTVDISPQNALVSWVMGYLNCQVIHHLFPTMPQFHQPEVSRRFALFCKEWGLKYQVMTYAEAWKATMGNLRDVGDHYSKLPTAKTKAAKAS